MRDDNPARAPPLATDCVLLLALVAVATALARLRLVRVDELRVALTRRAGLRARRLLGMQRPALAARRRRGGSRPQTLLLALLFPHCAAPAGVAMRASCDVPRR